ncbi:MAG TPA: hypothetical protein DDW67_03775 [Elusimicrobia bacterium]|nr:hypothetical protein [Elusimicrobiota bacterium]
MKKGLVLVIVVLFAAVMALQYAQRKGRAPAAGGQPAGGEQGVALPDDASRAVVPDLTADYSGIFSQSSGYDSMAPAAGVYTFAACESGTVEAITRDHGRIWGHSVETGQGFTDEENREIYGMLSSLVACGVVRGGDIGACGSLPGEFSDAKNKKIGFHESPSGQCLADASKVLFASFSAGLTKSASACHMYLSSDRLKNSRLSPADACTAVASGLPDTCETLRKIFEGRNDETFGRTIPPECYLAFPRKQSDCRDAGCKELSQLYEAMAAKNPDRCPAGTLKQLCSAAITYDDKVCAAMQKKLSQTYCAHYAKLEKAKGKYLGMTAAEEKAARAADALNEKAAKERQEKLDKSIREQMR